MSASRAPREAASRPGDLWARSAWWLLFTGLLLASRSASVQVLETQVAITFAQQVTVQVRFLSPRPIQDVYLFVHPEGGTRVYSAAMRREGDVWVFTFSPKEWHLPPFATVYYWFQVRHPEGEVVQTPSFTFQYIDDRFVWQRLQQEPFEVHWSNGDPTLAQEVINAGQEALQRMRMQWLAPHPSTMRIYVYPHLRALTVLLPAVPEWAGAYSYPALGTIFVARPAAGELEPLVRNVAHEVGHVVLYHAVQGRVASLPWWLQEGLASLAEPEWRPEYQQALRRAWQQEALLPLVDLCPPLQRQGRLAYLAYAQATSFVQFLQQRYGARRLHQLILTYAQGAACEEGLEQVYRRSLQDLEALWHQETLAFTPEEIDRKVPTLLVGSGLLLLSGAAFVVAWIGMRRLT